MQQVWGKVVVSGWGSAHTHKGGGAALSSSGIGDRPSHLHATSAGMVATALMRPKTMALENSVPRSAPRTSRATATSSPAAGPLLPTATAAAAAALLEAGSPQRGADWGVPAGSS